MPSWRTIFSRPMDGISALQITCAAGPGPKGGPDARNGRERGARRPSQDLNRACRQARRGLDRACGRVRRETTTVLTGHDDLRRPRLGLPQQAAATGSVATRHRSRLRTALTHLPGASPARDAVQNRAGAYVARRISQDLQFRPPTHFQSGSVSGSSGSKIVRPHEQSLHLRKCGMPCHPHGRACPEHQARGLLLR